MEHETDQPEVSPDWRELCNFRHLTIFDGTNLPDKMVRYLWERVRSQDYAFDDLSRDNAAAFSLALIAPQCAHFFLGNPESPSGWCMVKGLYKFSNPDIHFVIWDKDYSPHTAREAGREVLEWLFSICQCNRVTAMIPDYNPGAKRLAIMLRFQYEGCMKESILYHGRWRNCDVYGLLKKDFQLKVN